MNKQVLQSVGFYSPHHQHTEDYIMEDKPTYITTLAPESLAKFSEGWVTPTPDEIREAKRLSGKTGSELASLLGVDGRTVRKWIGSETKIPYAAWRLWLFSINKFSASDLL
jgi:DNA-binding transcriptional regulator YiaG